MTQDFSDEPLVVDGITIRPTWPWSREYREHVAEGMRAAGRPELSEKGRESRYIDWYAANYGLTTSDARQRVEAMSA